MYYTFLRTCNSFEEYSRAPKIVHEDGLTLREAQEMCEEFNKNRTDEEIAAGTKMEFEEE